MRSMFAVIICMPVNVIAETLGISCTNTTNPQRITIQKRSWNDFVRLVRELSTIIPPETQNNIHWRRQPRKRLRFDGAAAPGKSIQFRLLV